MKVINSIYYTVKKEKRKTNRCVAACARLLYVLWLLSYKEYSMGAKWQIHNNNKHSKYCKRSQKIKKCKKYSSSMSMYVCVCFYHDCFAKLILTVKCIHKLKLCAVCSFSLLLFSFIYEYMYMRRFLCLALLLSVSDTSVCFCSLPFSVVFFNMLLN